MVFLFLFFLRMKRIINEMIKLLCRERLAVFLIEKTPNFPPRRILKKKKKLLFTRKYNERVRISCSFGFPRIAHPLEFDYTKKEQIKTVHYHSADLVIIYILSSSLVAFRNASNNDRSRLNVEHTIRYLFQ